MSDAQTWVMVTGFVAVLGVLVTMVPWLVHNQSGKIDDLAKQMDRRFEQMDRRFEQMDRRFDRVDERLDRVESRIGAVEAELGGVKQSALRLQANVDHLSKTMDPIADELLRAGVASRPRAAR